MAAMLRLTILVNELRLISLQLFQSFLHNYRFCFVLLSVEIKKSLKYKLKGLNFNIFTFMYDFFSKLILYCIIFFEKMYSPHDKGSLGPHNAQVLHLFR